MKNGVKEKADLLTKRVLFRQNPAKATTSNYLATLQLAITNFHLTIINYQTQESKKASTRTVEPFALYSTHENWILIAWCRLRNDFRAFRVDRIKRLELLNDTFTPHNWSLQDYFDSCREKLSKHP